MAAAIMDVDPLETATESSEDNQASRDRARARLNSSVAVTVAILATFLGICKVKDDNIVQAMQQAQADRLDHWNFYQARNIRQEIAAVSLAQLKLAAASAPPERQAAYADAIASAERLVAEQAQKKEELRVQAEQDQRTYDALNFRDDQFDLSDALIALAISLLAVTALTHKQWLYWLALVPTVGGIAMGLAGLLGWRLHPDLFVRLLS
jgi:uncharacterized protein DUF4337